jgi:hypothetical protein
MQTHSHPHGVRGNKRTLGGDSCGDGISRPYEDDEERIAAVVSCRSSLRARSMSARAPLFS